MHLCIWPIRRLHRDVVWSTPKASKYARHVVTKTSDYDFELFVRELGTFSLSLKMVAPASGAKKQ